MLLQDVLDCTCKLLGTTQPYKRFLSAPFLLCHHCGTLVLSHPLLNSRAHGGRNRGYGWRRREACLSAPCRSRQHRRRSSLRCRPCSALCDWLCGNFRNWVFSAAVNQPQLFEHVKSLFIRHLVGIFIEIHVQHVFDARSRLHSLCCFGCSLGRHLTASGSWSCVNYASLWPCTKIWGREHESLSRRKCRNTRVRESALRQFFLTSSPRRHDERVGLIPTQNAPRALRANRKRHSATLSSHMPQGLMATVEQAGFMNAA